MRFWKMHGARNDFVLVDDREQTFPTGDRDLIRRLCDRHVGIGCEGMLLIQPSRVPEAHFRMRFINPDGSEVEMCGNGARCIARLAHDLGIVPPEMKIETGAGVIEARVAGEEVEVQLPPPRGWRMNRRLAVDGREVEYHFVDTGVPHVVILVPEIGQVDVAGLGRAIRFHPEFAPRGTNVNFVQVSGETLRVRTYERGVEAETLACGTGITAAALVCARLGLSRPPITVVPTGGDRLRLDFTVGAERFENVRLTGPAVYVFRGEVDLENFGPLPEQPAVGHRDVEPNHGGGG